MSFAYIEMQPYPYYYPLPPPYQFPEQRLSTRIAYFLPQIKGLVSNRDISGVS